jgi:putative transposase
MLSEKDCDGRVLQPVAGVIETYSAEIRAVLYSTNAIESLHARFRRSVRARGHFPNEQAALKCLYLTVRSLDPTGRGRARWINRWQAALNAFAVTFEDRIPIID